MQLRRFPVIRKKWVRKRGHKLKFCKAKIYCSETQLILENIHGTDQNVDLELPANSEKTSSKSTFGENHSLSSGFESLLSPAFRSRVRDLLTNAAGTRIAVKIWYL